MRRACLFFVVLGWGYAGSLWAQEGSSGMPVGLLAKFQAERAEAAKQFSATELKAADELLAKAQAAAKAGNLPLAERLLRDARWQLPFKPANLPENVSRVIGLGRLRHSDRVNALAYSPDGQRLASASKDGTVRIWDLGNGREIIKYTGHLEKKSAAEDRNPMWVPNVKFSPDGKTVASCGIRDIHLWDASSGQRIATLSGHGPGEIRGLAFGADANTLVSGGDDSRVILWDVKAQKPKTIFPSQPNRIEAVAVSISRKQIASVNAVGELHVYPLEGGGKSILSIPVTDGGQLGLGIDYAAELGILTCGGDNKAKLTTAPEGSGTSGTTVRSFLGHTDKLNCLAANPDGSLMVTGSNDRTVRVWDVASGKNLFTFQGHSAGVTAIAIRPDGKQAASACANGSIRLWPLARADENRPFADATEPLWTVASSPDGQRFATAGADRVIRIYEAATGQLQKSLTGHKGAVTAIQFLAANQLVSVGGDKLLKLWNLDDGKAKDFSGHTTAVLAVAADDTGKVLFSGSVDRTIRAWDAATTKPLWKWSAPSAVCSLAISQDRQRLYAGLADGELLLVSLAAAEPKLLGSVTAHGNGVAAIARAPDGSRIATCGGDGYIRLWTVTEKQTFTQLGQIEPPTSSVGSASNLPLTTLLFSNDGKQLFSAGAESLIRIVDAQTYNEVRSLRGHKDWVTSLALAPDGKTIYSASVDKTVRAFDISAQDRFSTLGHSQAVLWVAVHPDGKLLATASADGTVKIWDISTGQEVATLTGSGSSLNTVVFVAGKDLVAAGGDDQRVRWWSWNPVRELRSLPLGGPVFSLAGRTPNGVLAAAWVRIREKQAGFDLLDPERDSALAQVSEKGRELTCAALSGDASLAISGSEDGVVRIWELPKKERLGGDWPLFKNAVADVGLTPDKKTLIALDGEGQLRIGDIQKRTASEPIPAVTGGVQALVVSPYAERFVTLSAEGTVKLWNLKGESLRTWKLPSPANSAAFSPDGKRLYTGNADGTALVLELP